MQIFRKRAGHKFFLPSLQASSPATLQKNSLSSSNLQNPYAHSKTEATSPPPHKTHLVSPNNFISKPNALDKSKPTDVVSSNRKLSCFIRSGNLDSALELFLNMPIKTTVTWNSILAGLSKKRGNVEDAQKLFDEIPERDSVSYNTMLACYVKNSDLGTAREFFDGIPSKDSASWNTMITAFARGGKMDEAKRLFSMTWEKNEVSWNAMISGYVECGDMDSALQLFDIAPVKGVVSWTTLINGYMRKGEVELAERLFGEMPERNLVTWNAMVAGYVENCRAEDGMKLFETMMGLAIRPNSSTLSSVLLACSELSSLHLGCQVHQVVCKSPLCYDTTVGTSLVSMYCKCGDLGDGWKIFREIPVKDVVTWNAIISGYAQHGAGEKALGLFDEMRERGVKPDSVTFVGVLLACNHTGFVDLGLNYFRSMVKDYGVELKLDHYTCMVDLLGRSGKLVEAVELIKEMPFPLHAALFGSLLGACRIHKNVEIAEFAAKNLLELDQGSATAFVQLANVYAAVQKWDQVSQVRKSMKSCEVVKTPGYSWIEVKKVVHEFRSGDRIHPELTSIHEKLTELDEKMKLAGYSPELDFALHNVGEEQKEQLLLHHSEKLAVAYGLIRLPRRTKIQIFKNLRICGNCHLAIKYISAIEGREIVVRDTKRFHHFKDGICSCGDYW